MAFVKLDCDILDSTLWYDRDQREVFITALLMAHPDLIAAPTPQLMTRSLDRAGWDVPPGEYGLIHAAGVGIVRRSLVEPEPGLIALEALASPEPTSRSQDFDGRRLVRIDGGYVVLNYIKYREKDHGAAERMRRYRARKLHRNVTELPRNVTQAEAEAEAEAEADSKRERAPRPGTKGRPADVAQVRDYWNAQGLKGSPDKFFDHWESFGWRRGKSQVRDWKASARTWSAGESEPRRATPPPRPRTSESPDSAFEGCYTCRHGWHAGRCAEGCATCRKTLIDALTTP